MWITIILLIVVAIIVVAVRQNKEKEKEKKEKQQEMAKIKAQQKAERKEKQQQVLKELGPMITEKWAVCVSKFGRLKEYDFPPCLIKIEKREDITVALRITKGSVIDTLFVVDNQEVDKDYYSYSGHHPQTGDMGGIYIKPLDKDELKEYPNAKFALTLFNMDKYHQKDASFYLVLDLVTTDNVEEVLAKL